MLKSALLQNYQTRPDVFGSRFHMPLTGEVKPLPTLPSIVGDTRYLPETYPRTDPHKRLPERFLEKFKMPGGREPARCMAMSPQCMGEDKWRRHMGLPPVMNPGAQFLIGKLGGGRDILGQIKPLTEPSVNNPSTM